MPCGISPGRVKEASGKLPHFMPCGFSAGFTETAGRTPRKPKLCPAWWVPQRNVLLSDRNFIPLAFHSLRGTRCAGKDSPCLLAAVSPGTAFSSGRSCRIAGKLVCLCWKRSSCPSPLCREVTWCRSLALREGAGELLLLVERSWPRLLALRGAQGPSCSQLSGHCETLSVGPAVDLHCCRCFWLHSFSGASLTQSLDLQLGELGWLSVTGRPSCKAWSWCNFQSV